jgi:hypothetical protein
MGLLDFNGLDNLDDPKKQALLTLAAGLLGGAPGGRKNFGADLSHAGLLGLQAYSAGKAQAAKLAESKQQQDLHGMQMDQMRQTAAQQKAQFDKQQGLLGLQKDYYNPGSASIPLDPRQQEGGQQEIPGVNPGIDMQRMIPEAMRRGLMSPMEADALAKQERVTVAPGASLGRYVNGKFVTDFSAPDKPPAGFTHGPNGLEVDQKWLAAQKELALAKRPQTTVSVTTGEKPFVADLRQSTSPRSILQDAGRGGRRPQSALSRRSTNMTRSHRRLARGRAAAPTSKATIANYLKPLGLPGGRERSSPTTHAFASTRARQRSMLAHAKDLGANPSNADADAH